MKTAKIACCGSVQAVRLPKGIRFQDEKVLVRKDGDAVILEPSKRRSWPKGFFRRIRIDDPGFCRPDQGDMPETSSLAAVDRGGT